MGIFVCGLAFTVWSLTFGIWVFFRDSLFSIFLVRISQLRLCQVDQTQCSLQVLYCCTHTGLLLESCRLFLPPPAVFYLPAVFLLAFRICSEMQSLQIILFLFLLFFLCDIFRSTVWVCADYSCFLSSYFSIWGCGAFCVFAFHLISHLLIFSGSLHLLRLACRARCPSLTSICYRPLGGLAQTRLVRGF